MRDWFKWISIALLGLGSRPFSLCRVTSTRRHPGGCSSAGKSSGSGPAFWDVLAKTPFSKTALTRQDAERAEDLLAHAYLSRLRSERAQEMDENVLRIGDLSMPFFVAIYGEAPADGRSMFLSMHGRRGSRESQRSAMGKSKAALRTCRGGFMWLPELLPILGTFGIRIISMTFSSV